MIWGTSSTRPSHEAIVYIPTIAIWTISTTATATDDETYRWRWLEKECTEMAYVVPFEDEPRNRHERRKKAKTGKI